MSTRTNILSGGIFEDKTTKLLFPNLELIKYTAITNLVNETLNENTTGTGFFSRIKRDTDTFSAGRITSDVIDQAINILTIGLGVTSISTNLKYIMPTSKGIGSVGEILHLIGATNERVKISFTTDQYPGLLGNVLRKILTQVLKNADVVYIYDDMFISTPCLITSVSLNKEGKYRGAVKGELELIVVSEEIDYFNNNVLKYASEAVGIGVLKQILRGSLPQVNSKIIWIDKLINQFRFSR